MYYSKNRKLNGVLNEIENDLLEELGRDEIARYMADFPYEPDYNIAQYGNVLIYHCHVFDLYRRHGYKSTANFSASKMWETYRRQVGYVARAIIRG